MTDTFVQELEAIEDIADDDERAMLRHRLADSEIDRGRSCDYPDEDCSSLAQKWIDVDGTIFFFCADHFEVAMAQFSGA